MARTCAFCGKDELTKEHLFAKWIRDEYRGQSPSALDFQRDDSLQWFYEGDALEQTVKAFCAKCNNVWMSRLEERAAKVMRPMLRAKRVGIRMGYADQTTVATWVMKTAMVLQQLHPGDSRIPISDYRDFHRKQEPSSNVFILMGARHRAEDSKGANMFASKERYIGSDSSGIQHVHFALGALYFGIAIFIGRARRYPRVMNDDAAERALQVWPVQPRDVIWPSPTISDIGGVEGMFDAFAGASWGY